MPRLPLSDHDYLAKLQDYYARHQVFPSYAAIGRIVGLKSTSSVSAFLERLKADGYLEAKDRRLRPGARFFERPLVLSRVAAGLPAMAFEAPAEGLAIDAHLVRRPSRTFLITVKGDSMTDARAHQPRWNDLVGEDLSAVAFVRDYFAVAVRRSRLECVLRPRHRRR